MGVDDSIRNLHYLPIITFFLIPVTFFITYATAVSLGHVPAIFPFISDTGTFPPESCIFGQLLNIAAALISLIIYIRYSHTEEISSSLELPASLSKWNTAGFIFGQLTSLGLSVVANFQETSVLTVHGIGALVCFGCGTIYFWIQTLVSYKTRRSVWSLRLAHLRFCLALANTVFYILGFFAMAIASGSYTGEDTTQWTAEDGGWEWHLVGTVSEWLCAGSFCLYILTIAHDFRSIRLARPKVISSFAN